MKRRLTGLLMGLGMLVGIFSATAASASTAAPATTYDGLNLYAYCVAQGYQQVQYELGPTNPGWACTSPAMTGTTTSQVWTHSPDIVEGRTPGYGPPRTSYYGPWTTPPGYYWYWWNYWTVNGHRLYSRTYRAYPNTGYLRPVTTPTSTPPKFLHLQWADIVAACHVQDGSTSTPDIFSGGPLGWNCTVNYI